MSSSAILKLAQAATAVAAEAQAKANGRAATEEPWPEPDLSILSPHREPAPAFPLDVLGPAWAAWVVAAAESKAAPVDYVALALLASAGAILANHRHASPWAGWAEPPIIWAAVVGNPSSGKSPALDAVAGPLRKLEAELNLDLAERCRTWQTDKLAAELAHESWKASCHEAHKQGRPLPQMPGAAELPDQPRPRRLLVNDTTGEKLVRLSAANALGLLLHRDELAGWLGAMDRYGGTGSDRALFLEAWGGRPYCVDRVKDGDKPVQTPALSTGILGGIQPDRLATMFLAGDDDGLAARFVYTWPETRKPTRPREAVDEAAASARLRLLAVLPLGVDGGAIVLPLAPAAGDAFWEWLESLGALEPTAAGLFLSWLGKLRGYTVRLALVLEYLWWSGDRPSEPEPREVSLKVVLAAIGFLDAYAVPMARRVFGDAALPTAERDAVALARWLLGQSPIPERVNARQLRHAGALPTREPGRYEAALAELAEAGWVREAPVRAGDRPGRRRKDWAVNPALAGCPS